MLRAIAMALGLSLIWLVLAQPQNSPLSWMAMAAAVLACVACAWRLGGVADAYARAPRLLFAHAQRAVEVARGALAIVRTAGGGSFARAPALVRVRAQAGDAGMRKAFATLINATPGLLVVDADEGGLLIHALDEEAADASALARAAQRFGGAA